MKKKKPQQFCCLIYTITKNFRFTYGINQAIDEKILSTYGEIYDLA